jgi:hypothetical protein
MGGVSHGEGGGGGEEGGRARRATGELEGRRGRDEVGSGGCGCVGVCVCVGGLVGGWVGGGWVGVDTGSCPRKCCTYVATLQPGCRPIP